MPCPFYRCKIDLGQGPSIKDVSNTVRGWVPQDQNIQKSVNEFDPLWSPKKFLWRLKILIAELSKHTKIMIYDVKCSRGIDTHKSTFSNRKNILILIFLKFDKTESKENGYCEIPINFIHCGLHNYKKPFRSCNYSVKECLTLDGSNNWRGFLGEP